MTRLRIARTCKTFLTAVAGATLLALAACAPGNGKIDNAGYRLPEGSLAGVSAIITIVPQEQIMAMAQAGGVRLQRGAHVNGLAMQRATVAAQNGQPCLIYLADTSEGFAALEHELWHCRQGDWHK
jgi:hypothetical protein